MGATWRFPKMLVPPNHPKIRSFSSIEAYGFWGSPMMTSETLTLRWRKDVKTPRWRRQTSPEIGTLQNWRLMALGLLHGEVETINVFGKRDGGSLNQIPWDKVGVPTYIYIRSSNQQPAVIIPHEQETTPKSRAIVIVLADWGKIGWFHPRIWCLMMSILPSFSALLSPRVPSGNKKTALDKSPIEVRWVSQL